MAPSRGKRIGVPFDSQEHYAACVADPESFRRHLTEVFGQHPELCPARIDEGFVRHDTRWSIKQQLRLRRIELKATAGVFLVRPSCLMPAMVGRTADVEKALSLRHWGVPFDAVVSVFGRDAMLRQMVLTRCGKGLQFVRASRFPGAHRTSNALDRLMNHQDRRLDAMRSLHGTPDAARLARRAMALPWNFHPYGARTRRDDPPRRSPFHDLNGVEYHPNWLHNLLIASSMGGRKL